MSTFEKDSVSSDIPPTTTFLSARQIVSGKVDTSHLLTHFANHKEAIAWTKSLNPVEASKTDRTLPTSDSQRRALVAELKKAFLCTDLIDSGAKIPTEFSKGRLNEQAVEKVCWDLLDKLISRSQRKKPLTLQYGFDTLVTDMLFADRFDDLVKLVSRWKKLASWALTPPFLACIEDPGRKAADSARYLSANKGRARTMRKARDILSQSKPVESAAKKSPAPEESYAGHYRDDVSMWAPVFTSSVPRKRKRGLSLTDLANMGTEAYNNKSLRVDGLAPPTFEWTSCSNNEISRGEHIGPPRTTIHPEVLQTMNSVEDRNDMDTAEKENGRLMANERPIFRSKYFVIQPGTPTSVSAITRKPQASKHANPASKTRSKTPRPRPVRGFVGGTI